MKRLAVILAAPFALAACGSDPAPAGDGTVSGEVLEGSISDAMLPLDTLKSQSPPLEPAPAAADPATAPKTDDTADSAEEAEAAPEAPEPPPEG